MLTATSLFYTFIVCIMCLLSRRPWQKKLTLPTNARLLPAAFIVALLLAACGSSAWNLSTDETPTPYTTTVTGIVQDVLRTGFVGLPGVIVSASTATTATPMTTTTGSDGSYSLLLTHSGSFTLSVAKTCYQAVPTKTITATSSGPYYAKTIKLKPVHKPSNNSRFDLTHNADGSTYTLTVKCGVRTITSNEFRGDNSLFSRLFNRLGSGNSRQKLTVIKLPESLIRIEAFAFADHQKMSRELIIPPTVEYIGNEAFRNLSLQSSSSEQWVRLNFAPNSKLRFIGDRAFLNAKIQQFPRLPQSLKELKTRAFANVTHKPISNFTIPENVRELGNNVFATTSGGVSQSFRGTLTIKSSQLVRTPADRARRKTGRLGNSMFFSTATGTSLFTQIILHKTVFDTYTQADLNAIFGTGARYVDLADRTTELTP